MADDSCYWFLNLDAVELCEILMKIHLIVRIKHNTENDQAAARHLLDDFLYDGLSFAYWKSIVPPNKWEFTLGPFTENGVDRMFSRVTKLMLEHGMPDYSIEIQGLEDK